MKNQPQERILQIIRKQGMIRPRDLTRHNLPRSFLYRMHAEGLIERHARGVYVAAGNPISSHHSLLIAAKRIPNGVICLLSALQFHEIGTQSQPHVWMAIAEKARRPKLDYPSMRIVRFSETALHAGAEKHKVKGVQLSIYSVAKTVADCFKYRNKIGTDVAIEALKDALSSRKCTRDQTWNYATICRVSKIILPYMESLS